MTEDPAVTLLAEAIDALDEPADTDRIWRAMSASTMAARIAATPAGARLLAALRRGLACDCDACDEYAALSEPTR